VENARLARESAHVKAALPDRVAPSSVVGPSRAPPKGQTSSSMRAIAMSKEEEETLQRELARIRSRSPSSPRLAILLFFFDERGDDETKCARGVAAGEDACARATRNALGISANYF